MNWAILFPHFVAMGPNIRLMMDGQCLKTPKIVFSTAFFCAKVQNTSGGFIQSSFPFILAPHTRPVLDGEALSVHNGVQFSGEKLAASRIFFERARVWRFNARFRTLFRAKLSIEGIKRKI